jgi:hypothetical protein
MEDGIEADAANGLAGNQGEPDTVVSSGQVELLSLA